MGLRGIEFVEFASDKPEILERIFFDFGFSKNARHLSKKVDLFEQGDIHFLVNREPGSFSWNFTKLHGPCISSMGWKVDDPQKAYNEAVKRGARGYEIGDFYLKGQKIPAIYGIGDSLIYFVPAQKVKYVDMDFVPLANPDTREPKGFVTIDHLTNNVPQGTMGQWADFYKNVFGFTEVRYFDIRGAKTGLTSYALKSPCGSFCIPINEGSEEKSQINEYLREYKGPGVQHIAFLTTDILSTLKKLKGSSIKMLDIDDEYYKTVFERIPNVTEDHSEIRKMNVLVDGDEEGYLLQIFTKNIIGPIFIEIIQRKNHLSFGEGNFGALFRSIERDQEKRGVL